MHDWILFKIKNKFFLNFFTIEPLITYPVSFHLILPLLCQPLSSFSSLSRLSLPLYLKCNARNIPLLPLVHSISTLPLGVQVVYFKLYCTSKSPGRYVKTQDPDLTIQSSDLVGWGGAQEFPFLISSYMLSRGPHFENHFFRLQLKYYSLTEVFPGLL